MPLVTFDGQVVDVPAAGVLVLAGYAAGSAHSIAQNLCTMCGLGFVDVTGDEESMALKTLERLQGVLPHVDDPGLHSLLESLVPMVQHLADLNRGLVADVAGALNLPPPQDPRDRRKLRRRFDREFSPPHPWWQLQLHFQQLSDEAARAYGDENRIKRRIDARLAQLQAELSGGEGQDTAATTPLAPLRAAISDARFVVDNLSSRYGLPDAMGLWGSLLSEAAEELRPLACRTGDTELRDRTEAYLAGLRRVAELGDQLLTAAARSVGLPPPQAPEDREELAQQLWQYGASGPVWARDASFQQIARDLAEACREAGEAGRRVDARLTEMSDGAPTLTQPETTGTRHGTSARATPALEAPGIGAGPPPARARAEEGTTIHVSFGDRSYDLSLSEFLDLVARSLDGVLAMGRICCYMPNAGSVDAAGKDEALARLLLATLRTVGAHCNDPELRALLESLCPLAEELADLDPQMVAEAARFVNLPPPQDKRDRGRLQRRLVKEKSLAGPRWVYQPGFQLLGDEAGRTFVAENRIARRIEARLARLQAGLAGLPGEAAGQFVARLPLAPALDRANYAVITLGHRLRLSLPDVGGAWVALVRDAAEELGTLAPQITDPALREQVEALRAQVERTAELADQVLVEAARFFGLGAPQNQADREELRNRLPQCDAAAPVWAQDAGFQQARDAACTAGYEAFRIRERAKALHAELFARATGGRGA